MTIKHAVGVVGLVGVLLGTTACQHVFGQTESPNFRLFLQDVQTCQRQYTVAFGISSAPLAGGRNDHLRAQRWTSGAATAPARRTTACAPIGRGGSLRPLGG